MTTSKHEPSLQTVKPAQHFDHTSVYRRPDGRWYIKLASGDERGPYAHKRSAQRGLERLARSAPHVVQ